MSEPTLAECAHLRAEVSDVHSVLADPGAVPVPGSLAAAELEAARRQPGQAGPWGESPVRLAYTVAITNYSAALEHARAVVTLMGGEFTAVPASVLVRALVEVASQAWWLLEPDIGYVNRVRRVQALRYRSATEGEKAAHADGVPPEEYQDYTETTAHVDHDTQDLGLGIPGVDTSRPWLVYFCGNERLPTASHRVNEMLKTSTCRASTRCSQAIRMASSSLETSTAAARWARDGNSLYMVTLTFPHDIGMRLAPLLALVADGFRSVVAGYAWVKLKRQPTISGQVRAVGSRTARMAGIPTFASWFSWTATPTLPGWPR